MNVPPTLLNCISTSCCEGDCGCAVSSLRAQVNILDMNCAKGVVKKRGRICDCGILWKVHPRFAVVELKGGRGDLDLAKLVEQLQGGLDLLEKQLVGQDVDDFFPILLYRGKNDPTAALRNRIVKFRTLTRNVIAKPCGTDLRKVIGLSGRVRRRGGRKRLGSRK